MLLVVRGRPRGHVVIAPRTPEELAAQIKSLTTIELGSTDGYSKAADALWKAALLAFNYAADQVGATGFQAEFAALKFYGEALSIDGPFGIVRANSALYPQYDEVAKVRGWINDDWHQWLVESAKKKLAKDTGYAHPRVLAHWRALADGDTS